MVAVGFTIFGGLLFINPENEFELLEIVTFIFIIVINFVYLLFWCYLMSKTYEKYQVAGKIGKNNGMITNFNDLFSHCAENRAF